MRKQVLAVGVVAAALAGSAPAGGSVVPQSAAISETAAGMKAPALVGLKPGWTTFAPKGTPGHQLLVMRLKAGATMQRVFDAAAKGDFETVAKLSVSVGGIQAGQRLTAKLAPGRYVAVDTGDGPKGSNFLHGGVAPFTVAGKAVAAAAPQAVGSIGLEDYEFVFDLPRGWNGKGVVAVRNSGHEQHEIGLVRVSPGKTMADVKRVANILDRNPKAKVAPPGEITGLVNSVDPGQVDYVTANLKPGRYVAICFIPDDRDHRPHFDHGMIAEFTVS
jgi:hypothetical protein